MNHLGYSHELLVMVLKADIVIIIIIIITRDIVYLLPYITFVLKKNTIKNEHPLCFELAPFYAPRMVLWVSVKTTKDK